MPASESIAPSLHRRLQRAVNRLTRALLALLLLSVLYLSTLGVPPAFLEQILAYASRGEFVVQADTARLDLFRGLVVRNPRVYRKTVIGPPALEAAEMALLPDPTALLRRRLPVRRVSVRKGVIRPEAAFAATRATTGDYATRLKASVHVDECLIYGIPFRGVSSRCELDGPVLRFTRIRGNVGDAPAGGRATGEVTFNMASGWLEGEGLSLFDPRVVFPIFEAWELHGAIRAFSPFEFPTENPRIEAGFRVHCISNMTFELQGNFALDNCLYEGVPVTHSDGRIRMHFGGNSNLVTVAPLDVVRPEGTAHGQFSLDFDERTVTYQGQSSMDPVALARMIGVFPDDFLSMFAFPGPTIIRSEGTANFRNLDDINLTATVFSRGMNLRFFSADECAFDVHMNGTTALLSRVEGRMCDGTFKGDGQLILPTGVASNLAYAFQVDFRDMDLARVTAMVSTNDTSKYRGRLTGDLRLQGLFGEGNGRTVLGEGRFKIRDGHLFTMPIFGGLTRWMTRIIPGLDFVLSQTEAEAGFSIRNSRIRTRKLAIVGDILSLTARGDVYFNQKLNFKAQIRLLQVGTLSGRVAQFLTAPLTKLFEFRLVGDMDEPTWYPVNFSREILNKIGFDVEVPEIKELEEEFDSP